MYTYSKTGQDCGIVAIANYIGKTYDEVFNAARETGYLVRSDGLTNAGKLNSCLSHFGWRATVMPKEIVDRRKFTGLYRYCMASKNIGHIMSCIDGNAFDVDGSVNPLSHRGRKCLIEQFYAVYRNSSKVDTL